MTDHPWAHGTRGLGQGDGSFGTRVGQGDGSFVLTENTPDTILVSGVFLCREVCAGEATETHTCYAARDATYASFPGLGIRKVRLEKMPSQLK